LGYIFKLHFFNPMAGYVHILPKIGLKQITQIWVKYGQTQMLG